jgi:hypothetical protein
METLMFELWLSYPLSACINKTVRVLKNLTAHQLPQTAHRWTFWSRLRGPELREPTASTNGKAIAKSYTDLKSSLRAMCLAFRIHLAGRFRSGEVSGVPMLEAGMS